MAEELSTINPHTRRYPFFKPGMDPRKVHQEYRLKILKLLLEDKRPLSMAVIAEKTGISEVTTARICNELAAEGRIVWNTVGPAKVFRVVDDQKVAEVLNSAPLYGSNNT